MTVLLESNARPIGARTAAGRGREADSSPQADELPARVQGGPADPFAVNAGATRRTAH
jgi:hypothetical protein